MNLRDDEWEPEPTEPSILRRVQQDAKSIVNTNDLARLRTTLLAEPFHGAIPHEVRGTIWLLLLRLRSEDLLAEDPGQFAQSARHAVHPDNSSEQIEKDVKRTRPSLARFKQPAVRGALLRLLSLFCQRHQVTYVQGLNELLAPFILLADTGSNPRLAYALFSAFVARFAPWTLESSETRMFEVLKRLFKYFERLLLYHDPELYWLLDRHSMSPDLYATSWFITLYSRNFTVESVLALWDLLLLEDDPLGTSFFAIALLRSKRETLLSIDESRIPETLMMLTADSPEQVRHLWKIGSEMRAKHTPLSFQRLMTNRIINDSADAAITEIEMSAARSMEGSLYLQSTPDDLVTGDAQYFTWDCRTRPEYDTGHLAQASFLPLDHVRELNGAMLNGTLTNEARAELHHAADLCEQLRGSTHICLIGSGIGDEDKTDVNVLADYLTRLGIPYISTLRGGLEDLLSAIKKNNSLTSSIELVDYDRRKHDQARRARVNAQKKRDQEKARLARRAAQQQQHFFKSTDSGLSMMGGGTSVASVSSDGFFSRSLNLNLSRRKDETMTEPSNGSSFLNKSDVEVSNALNKALAGIGLNYAFSGTNSGASADREEAWSAKNPTITTPPQATSVGSKSLPFSMASPTSSITTSGADTPHRVISAGLQRQATDNQTDINDIAKKWSSGFSSTYMPDAATAIGTSNASIASIDKSMDGHPNLSGSVSNELDRMNTPGTSLGEIPSTSMNELSQQSSDWDQSLSNRSAADAESQKEQQRARRRWGRSSDNIGISPPKQKKVQSPWVRDAKPGWLSEDTMRFPLSAMPAKGFTVNMMDEQVMEGLQLFPCKARAERMTLRGKTSEFRRRYVGVSQFYLLLFGQFHNRSHLLEVKLIRYLHDIVRITFKRTRPELVTFSVHAPTEDDENAVERVVCLMPDGLTECVDLIRSHISGEDKGTDVNNDINSNGQKEDVEHERENEDRRKVDESGSLSDSAGGEQNHQSDLKEDKMTDFCTDGGFSRTSIEGFERRRTVSTSDFDLNDISMNTNSDLKYSSVPSNAVAPANLSHHDKDAADEDFPDVQHNILKNSLTSDTYNTYNDDDDDFGDFQSVPSSSPAAASAAGDFGSG